MRFFAAAITFLVSLACLAPRQAFCQEASVSWSGPYGGLYGGGGGGQSSQHDNGFVLPTAAATPAPVVAPPVGEPPIAADGHYGMSGALGGALVGYNYQFNRVVFGIEGDIGGGRISGHSDACGTPAHTCGTVISAEADVRGKLGLPIGRFLPFVAGGLAVADLQASDALFGQSGSAWRAGYTIGGGLEYKIAPRVGVRLEYLHAMFGQTALFAIVPGVPERISATTDIVRAAVTYSLN